MASGDGDKRRGAGGLDEAGVRALGARLARAHEVAPRCASPPSARAAQLDVERQRRAIADGRPELASLAERVARLQRRFLEQSFERLAERARSGRIRRLDGPLPRLAERRRGSGAPRRAAAPDAAQVRDTALDLASLALDLSLAGRGDLAERLLSAYAGEADDFGLFGVIDFQERACALERAAGCASQPDRHDGDGSAAEARGLLLLAVATRRPPLVPPLLVAVGGLVASGKTTFSRALADRLGAPRIEADAVRNALLGDRPGRTVHEARWAQSFEPDFEDRVYEELLRRADRVLASGRPLVIAACFPRARQREQAAALARRAGLLFLFVECRVDEETARARLRARDDTEAQDGWAAIHAELAGRWEARDALPPQERLIVDGARPLDQTLQQLAPRLQSPPAAGPC